MIKDNTLSAEYRPGVLLSEFPGYINNNEILTVDAAQLYLEFYKEKLKSEFKLKPEDQNKSDESHDLPSSILDNDVIERLKKVGAKSFTPRNKDLSKPQGFIWDEFKKHQEESIKKLATQIPDNDINDKIAAHVDKLGKSMQDLTEAELAIHKSQQTSKFGVYQGWEWQPHPEGDSNIFYLVNVNNPDKKITVKYNESDRKIEIKTNKKNMEDDKIVGIMLEITRNLQRYSGDAEQSIKTFGLKNDNSYDKQITKKLEQGINVLNEGVAQAKNTADQSKKLKFKD